MLRPVRALLLVGLAGCGRVVFVDPDRHLKAALVLEAVERLLVEGDPRGYLHARIPSRTGIERVRFSASGARGPFEVPPPIHVQDCGRASSCLSFVLPPGLPADADRLIAELPEIGHESSAPITVRRLEAHGVFGEARDRNTAAEVTIVDPIRRFYATPDAILDVDSNGNETLRGFTLLFPRTFEILAEPGPCRGPADPESSWTALDGSPVEVPMAFSGGADPLACVHARPSLPTLGSEVAFTTVPGRAQIVKSRHVYVAPTETSPLVFLPVFDLELPSASRCEEAQALVRSAILDAATAIAAGEIGSEILELDALQLAVADGVPCRQANDRTFSAPSVENLINDRIDTDLGPERLARVLVVYAANLDLNMPQSLADAFNDLRNRFAVEASNRRMFILGIAPERATSLIQVERQLAWIATEEPTFRETITGVLESVWPFRTTLHNDVATIVPLVTSGELGRYRAYRICASSLAVFPTGAALDQNPGIFAPDPTGPAYRVDLAEQTLVERSLFVGTSVEVDWEGCEALCDRPAPGGDASVPWLRTVGCP
jgi:hypothetical protein